MNSGVFYRRHAMPPRQKPVDIPPAEVSKLAIHGDPSQQTSEPAPERDQNAVRWVRPSELPTMVANRYVRRLVGANEAAVRQARQLPRRAIARVRIARTQSASNTAPDRLGGIGQ